jgi:hypothetical protein
MDGRDGGFAAPANFLGPQCARLTADSHKWQRRRK